MVSGRIWTLVGTSGRPYGDTHRAQNRQIISLKISPKHVEMSASPFVKYGTFNPC